MYPLLALAISVLIALFMDGIAVQYRDLSQRYQSQIRQMQVVALAENMEQFYIETTSLPADLGSLASSFGFEHNRGNLDSWQGYAISPVLNDGIWEFTRAVLFSKNPTTGVTPAIYLASNACGTGSFDSALSWCGSKDSRWFRRETRERYNDQITTQRARMIRMLQKFSDHYNVHSSFPQKDNLGVDLALNSISKLSTLVGYSGTAANCSGTFNFMNVPVDCGDMFDQWGGHIGYQFVSKKRIMLTSETPIFNASANRVVVASEYDYTMF